MAILLKTTLVQVSSIQITQVRVQNKGKSVWKSRYDGDVSPSNTTFKGVIPGVEARFMGSFTLEVVFGSTDNFRSEELIFDIVPFCSGYHCYLLSTMLVFLEEERVMQQSSVSISLSF